MATPTRIATKWMFLGVFALLLALVWFMIAERQFRRWIFSDRYVPGEFEITRFNPRQGGRSWGHMIEGVVRPSGEQLVTNDGEIAIRRFVAPGDQAHRRVPTREEIEGQHVSVLYWPKHAEVIRWWHPPTVIGPGTIHGGAIVRDFMIGVGFASVGLWCFQMADRYRRLATPNGTR